MCPVQYEMPSFLWLLWDWNIISILHNGDWNTKKPHKTFLIYITLPSSVSQGIRQTRKHQKRLFINVFSEFTCLVWLYFFFPLNSEIPNTNCDACTFIKLWGISEKLHWRGIFCNWFVRHCHQSKFGEEFRLPTNTDTELQSENKVNVFELSNSYERNGALMCDSPVLPGGSSTRGMGQI